MKRDCGTPEGLGFAKIQLRVVIVGYDKGEYWILHEVIECTTGQLVQLHQIFKIGDLTLLPATWEENRWRERKKMSQKGSMDSIAMYIMEVWLS